jgi:hypothetical protein
MMAQTELKRLKDYPLNEWMEAADGCDFCGEKARVMVTWVNKSGDFGDVVIQHRHKDESYDPEMSVFGEHTDVAGWEFSDRTLNIAGREWPTLKGRANIGPCLNCWNLVVGVPIILWPSDGKVEIDLCFKCAKELGILDLMKPSKTGRMEIRST